MNLKFYIRRIMAMDFGLMGRNIRTIHEKSGRSRLWLLQDMIRCSMKHGSGHVDYEQFEMYNMTEDQRRTYLTCGRNNAIVKQYNDPAYNHLVRNKDEFNEKFNSYLDRDWALMRQKEQAIAFLRKHDTFIIKPLDGNCGTGVQKLRTADFGTAEQAYDALWASDGDALLEEVIAQHPAVAEIYPNSVNTIRAVTLYKDGKARVITTCFRMGQGGNHVDNLNAGGLVVPVEETTGKIHQRAMDKEKKVHTHHPSTGNAITGFQFPDWEEAMAMVCRAAEEIPQLGYLGWDIAFSVNGPVLVECNEYPGNGLLQLPEHTPDKIGTMPKFDI
jgi:glutathione synthase/RimK-type ligase-like ATP-grasp enzyme